MEKEKKYDLNALARVLKLAVPYKGLFVWCIFLGLVMAPLSALRPYIIKEMVDKDIWNKDLDGLKVTAAYYMLVVVLTAAVRYFFIYHTAIMGQSVIRDFRSKVFNHISRLNMRFFDTTPIGTVTTRTINDVEAVKQIFEQGSLTILADILGVFTVLGMMFFTSWRLTLIFLIMLPFLLIATYIFKEKVKKAYEKVRAHISEMNAFLQERITGMRLIQIFNAEKQEMEKFKKINKAYTQANLDSIFYYAVFFPVVELINSIALAMLVYLGTNGIWNGTITIGAIISFPIFLNMFFRPIRMMADKFNQLQMGLVAAQRVFDIVDTDQAIPDYGKIEPTQIEGEIEFKNVHFSYDGENKILKDVNFKLEPGTTLAIVGGTGSGKTTIINLLNKFYPIDTGNILVDKRDINDYKLNSLRTKFAIVLQNVFLFNGTVFENITLRDQTISREKVISSAKQIGAHKYFENLPGGYDFNITERGSNLSMGQRQLISFVRALVSDPDVLILDEATSSIDTETEAIIQYAIEQLISKRSSIIIAHRLSTIRNADKIMVMEDGEVMEIGSHEELVVKTDGYYKRLYELQFSKELVS